MEGSVYSIVVFAPMVTRAQTAKLNFNASTSVALTMVNASWTYKLTELSVAVILNTQ